MSRDIGPYVGLLRPFRGLDGPTPVNIVLQGNRIQRPKDSSFVRTSVVQCLAGTSDVADTIWGSISIGLRCFVVTSSFSFQTCVQTAPENPMNSLVDHQI